MSEVYRVVVTREADNWLADVPQVEGAHTYAQSLAKLDREVREVIALALDLPDGAEGGLELDWDIHTGNAVWDAQTAQLRKARKVALDVERRLQEETAAMASALREEGDFSLRDTAFLTGVSHQRISQIV